MSYPRDAKLSEVRPGTMFRSVDEVDGPNPVVWMATSSPELFETGDWVIVQIMLPDTFPADQRRTYYTGRPSWSVVIEGEL